MVLTSDRLYYGEFTKEYKKLVSCNNLGRTLVNNKARELELRKVLSS